MAKIIFTGGSGKAGVHVVAYLLAQGHSVLNVDIKSFSEADLKTYPALAKVHTITCDLTDNGQVYGAFTTNFNYDNFENQNRDVAEVVIHFAAIPRPLILPDNETYCKNVVATYNVVEAAAKLGIKKIILASSQCAYGIAYKQGPEHGYGSVPFLESQDVNPEDPYGLSKVSSEVLARGYAKRYDIDIYALRIGDVYAPDEYTTRFRTFLDDPATGKRIMWSYTDARDLGQICDLCIQKSNLGFQIFNAVNSSLVSRLTTKEILATYLDGVVTSRDLQENETLACNRKIKELLGFVDMHDWKLYVQ